MLPVWGTRLVNDITRRDVRALVEAKAETAPVMANRLLAWLSRLFNFALEHEWIDANPAYRIPKPAREQSRSHRAFRHPIKQGTLVVPMHESHDVHAGTLHAILKRAGLK